MSAFPASSFRAPPAGASPPFRPGDVLTSVGLSGLLDRVRARQLRHLATIHGIWGVIDGLNVRADSWDDRGVPSVTIDPGVLVDASGRLRTLGKPANVGAPPSGTGAWRVVLELPATDGPPAPRWASLDDDSAEISPRVIELARWRPGGVLDSSFRPVAWRPGARASARVFAATVVRGSLPVAPASDLNGWRARVDTSASQLSAGVAYLVMPAGPNQPPAEASWSVKTFWDGGFIFEAIHWPLPSNDSNSGGSTPARGGNSGAQTTASPTLPVDLAWIAVETGAGRSPCPPFHSPKRGPAMSQSTASSANTAATPATAATPGDPTVSASDPDAEAPFALPERPVFTANSSLTAKELTDTVAFFDAAQDLHNLYLHDWGIAAGLGVSPGAGSTGSMLQVEPGLAIDTSGREIVLPDSRLIGAPTEAETRTGAWSLVISAPSDPASNQGALGWRDPLARTGPRALQPADVVLASVTFKGGKFVSLDASVRRPVRPVGAPSVSAGATPAGATVWHAWFDGKRPTRGAVPTGVSTHVNANVAGPVVIAQLNGTRQHPISKRVYLGPSFVVTSKSVGFDFVILFPNGLRSWGLSSSEDLAHLLDTLKDSMQWSVSWIAVTQSQDGASGAQGQS